MTLDKILQVIGCPLGCDARDAPLLVKLHLFDQWEGRAEFSL